MSIWHLFWGRVVVFDPSTDIWLEQVEQELRSTLNAGETPFLGLYAGLFKPKWKEHLCKRLQALPNPLGGYTRALQKWPATLATYLTVHVVEGYGQTGTQAVYPYIEKALTGSKRKLTQNDKDKLWHAFRRASMNLGLDVLSRTSGAHYMVDEYLHQAGVPLQYVGDLTDHMLQLAYGSGLPDDDDPAALRLWQAGLLERLEKSPISATVAHAIHADDNGFYVRLFLQLILGNGECSEQPLAFERAMLEALNTNKKKGREAVRQQRLAIPKVVWRDDILMVELPAGEDTEWRVTVGSNSCDYPGAAEPLMVPFDEDLPAEVTVANLLRNNCWHFKLWEDSRNNRFLLFDAAGVLICCGQLNQEYPLSLEPGEYTVVSRFVPLGFEDQAGEVSQEPKLYIWQIELGSGDKLEFARGPARVSLQAAIRPHLAFRGDCVRDVKGDEIYVSHGLQLEISIPREMVEADTTGFRLYLDPRGLPGSQEVEVHLNGQETSVLDLEAMGEQWKPGLCRLLVELRRGDLRRPMARLAAYVWNGLERVENRIRFHCQRLPANLDEGLSDNVNVVRDRRLLTYRDENKRFFRPVFNLNAGHTHTFTWSVPGVFLNLKDYSGARVQERPVHYGATLGVGSDSRAVLEVHSTAPGQLVLGSFRQLISSRTGMVRVHLSNLVEYLAPGTDTLEFLAEGSQVSEPLVRLVTPHQVLNFEASRSRDSYTLCFALTKGCEELRCHALELLSGREEEIELKCNDPQAIADGSAKAWLLSELSADGQQYIHTLECPLERWPAGAWLLSISVKLSGRWGALCNERQDIYAGGVLVTDFGQPASTDWLQNWLEQTLPVLAPQEQLRIFRRIHNSLLPCYAKESCNDLSWLSEIWRTLAYTFKPQDGQYLMELVKLSTLRPPETSSVSWFPLASIGAYLPWIYCRPAAAYSGVADRASSCAVLPLIHWPLCDLFKDYEFDLSVAAGFGNLGQMNLGQDPKGFSFARYRQALESKDIRERWSMLRREDWRPGHGDYLGPLHYRYALELLKRNYRDTLNGNARRRTWALKIINALGGLELSGFVEACPQHLVRAEGLELLEHEPEEGWNQEQQNLLGIEHFLCLFAAVSRWEARRTGTLQHFQEVLEAAVDVDQEALHQAMGYLLYVGAELYTFYLLLWELLCAADVDKTRVIRNG